MLRFTLPVLFTLAGSLHGQIVSYECNSFPEQFGFERVKRPAPPDRWLEDGLFFLHCEVVYPERCEGEDEFYRWNLKAFSGVPRFFVQWRVITDGPRSEIPDVAPASMVASGQRGIRYHFTIARDRMRFLPDVRFPVWADIEPDVPHEYILQIYGEHWFEWTIDDKVIGVGVPPRTYPTEDSFIKWGARAACHDSTTAYDYVRFGVPEEEPVDCDAIRGFKAFCRNGRIKAKVKSSLDEGTELTVTNDGDHRTMRIKPSGRGKVKYPRQTGEHTILLLDCPHVSQVVDCAA